MVINECRRSLEAEPNIAGSLATRLARIGSRTSGKPNGVTQEQWPGIDDDDDDYGDDDDYVDDDYHYVTKIMLK